MKATFLDVRPHRRRQWILRKAKHKFNWNWIAAAKERKKEINFTIFFTLRAIPGEYQKVKRTLTQKIVYVFELNKKNIS